MRNKDCDETVGHAIKKIPTFESCNLRYIDLNCCGSPTIFAAVGLPLLSVHEVQDAWLEVMDQSQGSRDNMGRLRCQISNSNVQPQPDEWPRTQERRRSPLPLEQVTTTSSSRNRGNQED